jgi:hypothetical protein
MKMEMYRKRVKTLHRHACSMCHRVGRVSLEQTLQIELFEETAAVPAPAPWTVVVLAACSPEGTRRVGLGPWALFRSQLGWPNLHGATLEHYSTFIILW